MPLSQLGRAAAPPALLLLIAALAAWLLPATVEARSPVREHGTAAADNSVATGSIALPKGERVIQLAWASEGSVLLLTQSSDGYALRLASPGDSSLAVVPVPRSFSSLQADAEGHEPIFALAANGTALAVLDVATRPLEERELQVYRLGADGLQAVRPRLAAGFWPALLAWDDKGENLYLAQRSFINPEQNFSLGKIELASGEFKGLVQRGNLDLIQSMAFVPGRNAIALIAGSMRGEYPLEPCALLVDLEAQTMLLLNAEAAGLALNPLADGRLLLAASSENSKRGAQVWQLLTGTKELTAIELLLPSAAQSLQSSADGTWTGMLASPSELGSGKADTKGLVIQQAGSGKSFLAADECSAFAFAPRGDRVCIVTANGAAVRFAALPST